MRALLLVSVLCAVPAFGLEPYLVKDINPVPEPASSSPSDFVTLGSVALFSVFDGSAGSEVWRSDGTEAGTWQVTHFCQPYCNKGNPQPYALTSRHYFFRLLDEGSNWRLWATDGTPAGTFQLSDPSVNLFDTPAASVGDVLYFNASVGDDEDSVDQLWRSDGTPVGTWRVTDQSPYSIVAFQGSVYFTGEDGALWKTDDTPAGTVRVAPFPGNRSAVALFVVGSRLVVKVYINTPGGGEELWSSDGTAEGTRVLSDPLWFPSFSVQGGRLYFVAEDDEDGQELWVTDGTLQNTRVLTSLPRRDAFFSYAQGYFLELPRAAAGNRFVFLANDGPYNIEPWVTDGTVKGTRQLKDLCPGYCEDVTQVWDRTLPGLVFMTVTTRDRGNELWVTDGTEAGTRPVRDICPGSCGGHPYAPFVLKDRLIFVANDGGHGDELWTTNGTEAGTTRISDFALELPWYEFDGTVAGGQLLFDAPGPEGDELWRTDGTAKGVRLVRDIATADVGGSHPFGLMGSGSQAFFFTYPPEGNPEFELWKSDGTDAGTVQVRLFHPEETDGPMYGRPIRARAGGQLFFLLTRTPSRLPVPWRTDGTETGTYPLLADNEWIPSKDPKGPEMRAAGKAVFFPVEELEHGVELWTSDGTVAGTRLVRDVEPGTSGSEPADLTEFQGKLYFSAFNESLGRELWRTDGTEIGTDLVKAIQPVAGSNPSHLTVHAHRLWFFADDGEHGRELWSSDGTPGGTVFAVDIEPGAQSFEPSLLVSLGDRLLISGRSPSQGSGIWVTDGTAAGTRMISRQRMEEHAVFRGRVWFDNGDSYLPYLWVSDGTETGTMPVLDRDGQPIPDPGRFAVLGSHLLFTAAQAGVWRRWLWESDGTQAGTVRLLPEIEETELVRAGSHVFFPAFNRETGNELWAVGPAHP